MSKIKKILAASLVLFTSVLQLAIVDSNTALAAPARCYTGSGETFRLSSGCEPTNARHAYYDISGNRITGSSLPDDTCYEQDVAVTGGARFNEAPCTTLAARATQIERNLCQNSGGSWTADASLIDPFTGTATMVCRCPSGENLVQRLCEARPAPPASDSESPNDVGRTSSRPNDCSEQNLDGSNCGIINYLNIFMNIVSGAIAIAVIGNIIYAGIQYSMSQGDPGNVGKAKTRIRNALVAFIMYVSLFGFLQWLVPGGVF